MVKTKVFSYKNRNAPVELKEIDIPDSIGENEILVRTNYIGLNPVDMKLKKLAIYNSTWRFGEDFSGIVAKVGSKAASRFSVGDKVCGFRKIGRQPSLTGSLSRIDITCNGVIKQPRNLDDVTAGAFCLVYATAWGMLDESKVDKDASFLVLGGASATGSLCIQLLKRVHRVRRVVATCSSASAEDVRKFGADEIIDYRAPDYLEQLKAAAAKDKFLSIYDCIGGYAPIQISGDLLLPSCQGSTFVTINGDAERQSSYSGFKLLDQVKCGARMEFRKRFGQNYGLRYKFPFASYEKWPETGKEDIEKGQITLTVGSVFKAEEISKAWATLDKGSRGKVVLRFDENVRATRGSAGAAADSFGIDVQA